MIKVSLISLGCAKNLVDSEIMVGHLHQAGMQVIPEAEKADVVIVNTCSFIDSSKEESIGHILEVHQNRGMKKRRKEQKLIVAGCMSQRFSKDLSSSLADEVDAFIGLDQVTKVAPIIEGIYEKERGKKAAPESFVTPRSTFIPDYDTPRFRLTPKHFAYIKIAEGCNHPCTFCIIPQIRGRHRSRTVESVVAEARQLVREGVREINLISQDTTFFGMDTWEQRPNPRTPVDSSRGTALTTLLRQLNAIEGDFWIRLLYTHPAHWSDELIRTIAECPKVARYIDIPLQHISDHMLTVMQRETSSAYIRDLTRFETKRELQAEFDRRQQEQEAERALTAARQTFEKRLNEAFPDGQPEGFKAFCQIEKVPVVLNDVIMHSESGPQLAAHYGDNPADLQRLSALPLHLQAYEIAKVEARLSGATTPATAETPKPKPKIATDAPSPAPQVRGAGGQFKVSPDTDDFAAFEKAY